MGDGAAATLPLAHMKMDIPISGQLRQMGHDDDLMPPMRRQFSQFAPDGIPNAAANPLINFIKNEGRGAVYLG